jgi:RNA polymerase sigma-70 factor (ECF subfamily)
VEGRPLEDAELVDRSSRGDVSAYEELVRRHQRVAIRVAFLSGGSAAEAEDAAQEAFVKAFRALPRFRAGAAFRPWLLAIVANEARNRRRAAGRRDRLAARFAAVGGEDRPHGDAAPSPEEAVLAGEDRDALLRAVSAMRPEDRLVIAYRYFLELPEAETAAALGWPRGTVKSRLSRALGRLREALGSVETSDVEGAEHG